MDQPGQTPEDGDEIGDPVVQARIRELLAAAPDPGPLPEHVTQRIESLLSDEVALRVDPGPLAQQAQQTQAERDRAVLAPLIRQRQRPRPLFALAAVAAAAAVVAVGGSALHLNKQTNGAASLGDASAIIATPTAPSNLHIQLSSTNYTAADLPAQARTMLTRPDTPSQVLAAEAPTLGPIATEEGLGACLTAHSLPTDVPVHVDVASYEEKPAAIIVVTEDGRSTVRVVERTCTTGNPATVAQSTAVP